MATITTANSLASQIVSYYDKVMLEMLEDNRVLVFHQFGEKKPLPKNEGNAVIWHRWNAFGKGRFIAESGAGAGRGISATKVSANLWMFGDHAIITTMIDMVSINPVVEGAVKLFGQSAALTLDFCIGRKLLHTCTALSATFEVSSTNGYAGACNLLSAEHCASAARWQFPMWLIDDLTTRSHVLSSLNGGNSATLITPKILRAIRLKFEVKNCMPFDDGFYKWIAHPDVINQLRGSSAYIDLHKYTEMGAKQFEEGTLKALRRENGLRGVMEGFKIYGTPQAPYCTVSNGATGASSHGNGYYYFSLFFGSIAGQSAYGVTDFDGGVRTFIKVPGPQSTDNPLDLYSKVGYRFIAAAKALNASAGMWLVTGKPLEQG